MQDPDDVVERLAVHRVARVRRVEHRLERLLRRQRDRDRGHLGARHHHVGDLLVGEVEDLVEHLLLLVLDLALLGRAREQHPQLGLRVSLALGARRLELERTQDHLGRPLEQPDQRPEHDEEHADGARDPEGGALRVPERDPLGNELADHHVQVRDHEQREHDGEERRHDRVEAVGEHLLAERADRQGRDRHAQLHRGDEPRRVTGDAEHAARLTVPLVDELHDPRPARRDEAVLGRHEERVQDDQPGQGQQLERECGAS